jgi:hypothetical protein
VADYERAAVPGATSNAATNSSLTHPALAALDGVLRGSGRFVREEQVLSTLIADLTRAAEAEA